MKIGVPFCAVFGGLLSLVTGGCAHSSADTLKVFYMPFIIQTLNATTPDNIVRRTKPCVISASKEVEEISGVLDAAVEPGRFSLSFVRVRIDRVGPKEETTVALVDQEGAVRRSGSADRQLPPDRLEQLKQFLAKRCEW